MKRLHWGTFGVAFLVLSCVLGGASAAGALANLTLQVVGLILILLLLWQNWAPIPVEARWLLGIGALLVLAALISLIPLPAELFSSPLRKEVIEGFTLLGWQPADLPISLTPGRTLGSIISIVPPAAMFLLVLRLSNTQRRLLPWGLLVIASCSLLLGVFQLMGGGQSPLRFYEITNTNLPVGFFANANHNVTLMLTALPFCGYLAARGASDTSRAKINGRALIALAIALLLTMGIIITGSNAGYGLLLPTILGAFIIYRRTAEGRLAKGWGIAVAVVSAMFVAAVVKGPLGSETLVSGVADDAESRGALADTTIVAIRHSFPEGTGLGSFGDVYRRFEGIERIPPHFTNHAHNDYVELVLELGVAGVILILAFIGWWALATLRVWRSDYPGALLGRAASVAIGVVLLHSLVDYPLRSAAIAVVFAAACALMIRPPSLKANISKKERIPLRHVEAD